MGFQRRRLAVVGCIALVSIILAGWSLYRQFHGDGALFARRVARRNQESGSSPENLPPFVVRRDGRAGKIQPVQLPWEDARGGGGLLNRIGGCLPAGQGVDVLWSEGGLYLVKRKGLLKRVWGGDPVEGQFRPPSSIGTSVCFDGKYVWAALTRSSEKAPRLIVLDPQSEESWEFGAEHGLPFTPLGPTAQPQESAFFSVGPIGPGKACVAAWSRSTQLAIVRFDPKTGVSSKVFHRAETSVDATPRRELDPQTLRKTDVSFQPDRMLRLAAPEAQDRAPAPRMLIGRHLAGGDDAPPLLLDAEALTLEVVETPPDMQFAFRSGHYVVRDDAIYWLKKTPALPYQLVLARAASPKFEEELLLTDMAVGRMTTYDDRICVIGRICWLWQPGSPNVERIAAQTPWTSRGYLHVGASSTEPIFEGKRYYLDDIFPSQHYGVLATASVRQSGPNFAFSDRTFQFELTGDPQPTPDSHETPGPAGPQLAEKLPAGASASELTLFPADSEGRIHAALGKSVEANDEGDASYPVLAREIVRQAFLMAARDELQWTTRDAALYETSPAANDAAAKFLLHTQFSANGDAQFWLNHIDDRGRSATIWREKLAIRTGGAGSLDYGKLVEAAERWSREIFPKLLQRDKLTGERNASGDAAVSPAAAKWLGQLTFTAQFAVLRELHHAIRRQGESDELLGALVRAYANLGVITEFHWTALHKACKARALLYAERLLAKNPTSAWALRHRAYAEALIGLHQRAIDDLQLAQERSQPQAAGDPQAADEKPGWVGVIDAYCRFDGERLAAMTDDAEHGQLAGLLRFFQVESMKKSYVVQELTRGLLQKNPECFRLFDAMCESCAIGMLHVVTELAPAVLRQTTPQRLQQLSGLPPDTAELLKRQSVREVGLTELADSLLQTGPADDAEEFSWTVLGGLLQEVEFLQLWRRAHFMRFQWAVPTDEFIAEIEPQATSHRFRPLIELCADSASWDARCMAADALTRRLDLAELDYPQLAAFQAALDGNWPTTRTELYVKAQQRPGLHLDDVHRDLLSGIEHRSSPRPVDLVQRLMQVSPTSPDAVAAWIRSDRLQALKERPELEKKFADDAQVWAALANVSSTREGVERALRTYIKLSPDLWAYQRLTASLKAQEKMKEWKAAVDEFLSQPEAGLTHAQMRVEVANYHMDRMEWEQARPYAAEAAETWAEWAMMCAIRCYRGLGDVEQESLWRARLAERYPKVGHWLEWYFCCRRNGVAGSEQAVQIIDPLLAAEAEQQPDHVNYHLGAFYQLSGRPSQALAFFLKCAAGSENVGRRCQAGVAAALIAHDLGDKQARDEALTRVAGVADPAFASWTKLARWLQASVADSAPPADLDAARGILAAEPDPSWRVALNYFVGRYLGLRGQWDDAVPFLQFAASDPHLRFTDTRSLACAALRDHGLKPDPERELPSPHAAAKPDAAAKSAAKPVDK
ncbi:MAG TPA: hypothetical protein VGN42_23770 [Pirellulales bacterium]|nr:hypothetical protein [Pirellulales bacterium]